MQGQRRKSIVLAELLIAFLFFSLSAAVALRLFASGNEAAVNSKMHTTALLEMQGWAERLYAAPDGQALLEENGWTAAGATYQLTISPDLLLIASFSSRETGAGRLREAALTALHGTETILTLPVSRYEGREGE